MKTILSIHILVIDPSLGHDLFSRIYLAAFFLAIVVFLTAGLRKKIPVYTLLLTLTTSVFFFILGNKLFAWSGEDWHNLFTAHIWPVHGRKTMIGGLAGLVVALFLLSPRIRRQRSLIDLMAFVIPAGMIIQRVGCLLAGCCHGTPTTLPWGITYTAHSHAWISQVLSGTITPGSTGSLPVHPTQVYDMLGCLMIMILVAIAGKRLKAPGSRLLLAVALYGIVRFCIDFVRDPGCDFVTGSFLGLKLIQWGVAAGVVVIFALILYREYKYTGDKTEPEARPDTPGVMLTRTALLSGLFFIFLPSFGMAERIVNGFLLSLLVAFTCRQLLRHVTVAGFRMATLLSVFAVILLSSQTVIPTDPGKKVGYVEISLSGATNTFYNTYRPVVSELVQSTDCNGNPTSYYDLAWGDPVPMKHQTVIGGIDIRKKFNLDRYRRISAGAGLYLGSDLVNVPEAGLHQSNFIWAVNPSFTFDQRWIGFKAGLVFGTFYFSGQEKDVEPDNANYDGALKPFHFMPQLGLRLGPYDLFYAEVKAFDHVPPIDPLYPFT